MSRWWHGKCYRMWADFPFRVCNDNLVLGGNISCRFVVCLVVCLISSHGSHVNQIHLCKESLWTRLKTKSQVPRDDVLVDLFMTWWTNWEPASLSVVSTYVTWSNKRYLLFLKNDIAFVYSGVGRTYQLRIAMLCKGFITFSWYWLVLYIKQIFFFFYRHNFDSPWSASSQGIFG